MTSHGRLPQRTATFGLLVVLVSFVAACDGKRSGYRSPTAPADPGPAVVATPTPAPPPAADLTGFWAGTVTVTYDDDEGSCAEPASARFAQTGAAVTATLTDAAGCNSSNEFRFEGTLEGETLYGKMIFPAFVWPTYGRISEGQLTLTAFNVRWDLRR